MERLCGCPRERLVNSGARPPEGRSGTALLRSTACGKQICAAGPAAPLSWSRNGSPRSPSVTAAGGMSPEGRSRRRAGPLPGAGSAGGSAGRFVRWTVPRLAIAARRLPGGPFAPGSTGSPFERGDVPVLPPVDEAIGVVEVLIGGQQVRVCPHSVPAGGAPDVGQLAPDEGRLAQLARP